MRSKSFLMNFKGHFMEKSIASTNKSQSYKMSNRHTHFYGEGVIYPFVNLAMKKSFKLKMN